MYQITPLELKAAAQKLPPSPQIFSKLGKMLKDRNTGVSDITKLVSSDASLAAQVLRISNSAAFSLGEPIDTLDEAINRVGFRELFRVVGMAAASTAFASRSATYNVEGSLIWENSLCSGLAMELLARKVGIDMQEAYTLGLLRSVGKLIVDACLKIHRVPPRYFANKGVPVTDWERATFGTTNAAAASFVLASWNFPPVACEAIEYQYYPEIAPSKGKLARLLNVAAGIADKVGKGIPGEESYWDFSDETLEEVRLEEDDIFAISETVSEKIGEVVGSVAR